MDWTHGVLLEEIHQYICSSLNMNKHFLILFLELICVQKGLHCQDTDSLTEDRNQNLAQIPDDLEYFICFRNNNNTSHVDFDSRCLLEVLHPSIKCKNKKI